MGRPANDTPTRFTVTVRGNEYSRARWRGRVHHLGPAGTEKADRAWADLLRRVADDPGGDADLDANDLLVTELFARYLDSPDAPKTEYGADMARLAGKTLTGRGPAGVAGHPGGPGLAGTPAAAVSGKDWKKWRRWLCALPRTDREGKPHPAGGTRYAASTVRQIVQAAVRAYKWAASEGLVPQAAVAAAETAASLASGTARPNRKRTPADPAHVAAARPRLRPPLRAAVDLMLLTAARPSELLRLTPAELHTGGVVDVPGFGKCDLDAAAMWVYTPEKHKTAGKGFGKAVWFTREAQAVLAPWLAGLAPGEYAFSPRRDRAAQLEERRARRTTRPRNQPSRAKRDPKRRPGEFYPHGAFLKAVVVACEAAGVPAWTPYQLRHLAKRTIEERHGAETARSFLGHAKTDMTDKYGGFSFARVKAVGADSAATPPPPSPEAPPLD